MRQLYLLTVLMVCSSAAFSQDVLTSEIEWNSVSTFDVQEGMAVEESTKVVTSQSQLKWYDANGAIRKTYDITKSEGSWTNLATEGAVLLHVVSEGTPGIVQIMRANGRLTIRIQLVFEDIISIHELLITTTNSL